MFDFLKRLRVRVGGVTPENVESLLDQKLRERQDEATKERQVREFVRATFDHTVAWFQVRADTFQQRGYSVRDGAQPGRMQITAPNGEYLTVQHSWQIVVESLYGDSDYSPSDLLSHRTPEKAAQFLVKEILERLP